MSIPPELLAMLVCPLCKTELKMTPDGTGLVCGSCRRRYAIVDDIPNMLVEEATILPEDRP